MLTAKRVDATKGPLIRQILTYTYPLFLSALINNLFHTVDLAVLGNMADTVAVASVGATGVTVSLMLNLFYGLASGTKILLARFLGEKATDKIQTTADTAIIMAFLAGLLIAVSGWFVSPQFLRLLNCPEDCFDGAVLYLQIYLSAAPAVVLYYYCAAILNASGNTRSPLLFMILSGVTNLVLNVILCLVLSNKVLAVALASAFSQLLGAVLTLSQLASGKEALQVRLNKLQWSFTAFRKILAQGLPIGLYNILFPLGSLQISAALNAFGASAIAGTSASATLETIANTFHAGIGSTCGVFLGQNLGAEKHDRVRKSLLHCLWLSASITFVLGNTIHLTGKFWLQLLLPDDHIAWEYALTRMGIIMVFGFISATNNILTHLLQAFGYSFLTSVNSVVCVLGFRVVWMTWIYPLNPTFHMLMACFLVSWLLMLATNTVMFTVVYLRYRKGKYRQL